LPFLTSEEIMKIDDRARRVLAERLDQVPGTEEGDILLAHLPPVGWADVVTKHDLAGLEERVDLRFGALEDRIDLRFDAVDQRFGALEKRMDLLEVRMGQFDDRMASLQQQVASFSRQLIVTVVAAVAGTIPTVFAVSHYAG
jgi:hypothetical protein